MTLRLTGLLLVGDFFLWADLRRMPSDLERQKFSFGLDTSSGRWRWSTVMDTSASVVVYTVEDIRTPFGLLRDSIPLPGDVVAEMASSISTIQDQFPPNILVGPPTSLIFTVDEGRGYSDSQDVPVTNDGTYGSLLSPALSTSAAYIHVSTPQLGGIAYNETGTFQVVVDSTDLLSSDSPITGEVVVQDPNAVNTPVSVPVTIEIRPKAEIDVSPTTLEFTAIKPLTGAFAAVPSQQFTIENVGPAGSVLDYQIQRVTNLSLTWLKSFSPVTGTLNSGESQIITVAVAPDQTVQRGTHTEILRVSGYSSNTSVDVSVELTVS